MGDEVGMTAATAGEFACTGCLLVMEISSSVYPVAPMKLLGM
jgi:hypothetical protein